MAEEKRRVTRAASALVGGGSRSNSNKTTSPSESFAQVSLASTISSETMTDDDFFRFYNV